MLDSCSSAEAAVCVRKMTSNVAVKGVSGNASGNAGMANA